MARQLDFWIGDWDLVVRQRASRDGDPWLEAPGTNRIRATMGGCVIEEHFRADGPGAAWTGSSASVYVPDLKTWRQTWVDDSGNYLAFTGGKEGNAFVLYGEPRTTNAKTKRMRMVFDAIEEDAFVWTWERKMDGEAKWTPEMEIRYTRRRPPSPGASCESDPSFHDLDFWLGSWRVVENGKPAGSNRIEKIMSGCAVVEHWKGVDGSEGQSLFHHEPGSARWVQVWVTDRATLPGGAKEKTLVARLKDGALRFEGEVPAANGGTRLDRTTLVPLKDGTVHQRIEISSDRGLTWKTVFDASYVRG
jgi:hypothetical protein